MKRVFGKIRKYYSKRAELKLQLKWLAMMAKPCLPQLLILFAIQSAASVISILLTLFNKQIIDQAIAASGHFDTTAFVLLVVLTLGNILLGVGGQILSSRIGVKYTLKLRAAMFSQMIRGEWAQLKRYHSGDIQSRITGDLNAVTEGILALIPECLGLFLRLVLAFIVLCRYDAFLALAALLLGPFGLAFNMVFAGKMKAYHVKLRENDAEARCFMQETTENVVVLKTFAMEGELMKRYEAIKNRRIHLVWKKDIFTAAARLSMNLVFTGGYLLAFGWGILQVSHARITYGTMSIFLSLINQIEGPIMGISGVVSRIIATLAAAGRVMELEKVDREEEKMPTALTGAVGVRVSNVSFAYHDLQDEQEAVLDQVSLDIRPGESVALIGATGSGKTTIARLLLRLLKPDAGTVAFYDAQGRTEQASVGTRSLISYVPQGNTLSSGTIRDNLLAGGIATEEQMRSALMLAEAGFALELGLDARIGERGIGLSEGQAQRLAIARALLRDAPFLILDEASASLDMETEHRIMQNLKQANSGKTVLVITHRPSLLALCDRCYLVKDGSVTEKHELDMSLS